MEVHRVFDGRPTLMSGEDWATSRGENAALREENARLRDEVKCLNNDLIESNLKVDTLRAQLECAEDRIRAVLARNAELEDHLQQRDEKASRACARAMKALDMSQHNTSGAQQHSSGPDSSEDSRDADSSEIDERSSAGPRSHVESKVPAEGSTTTESGAARRCSPTRSISSTGVSAQSHKTTVNVLRSYRSADSDQPLQSVLVEKNSRNSLSGTRPCPHALQPGQSSATPRRSGQHGNGSSKSQVPVIGNWEEVVEQSGSALGHPSIGLAAAKHVGRDVQGQPPSAEMTQQTPSFVPVSEPRAGIMPQTPRDVPIELAVSCVPATPRVIENVPLTSRGTESIPGATRRPEMKRLNLPERRQTVGHGAGGDIPPPTPRGRSSYPLPNELQPLPTQRGSQGVVDSKMPSPRGRSSSAAAVHVPQDPVPSTPRGRSSQPAPPEPQCYRSSEVSSEDSESSMSDVAESRARIITSGSLPTGQTPRLWPDYPGTNGDENKPEALEDLAVASAVAELGVAHTPTPHRSNSGVGAMDRSCSTQRRIASAREYYVEIISPRTARKMEQACEAESLQQQCCSPPLLSPRDGQASPRSAGSAESPPMLLHLREEFEQSDSEEDHEAHGIVASASCISLSSTEGDIRDRLRKTLHLPEEAAPAEEPMATPQAIHRVHSNGSSGILNTNMIPHGWVSPAAPATYGGNLGGSLQGMRPPQAPGWTVRRSESSGPMQSYQAAAKAAGQQTPPVSAAAPPHGGPQLGGHQRSGSWVHRSDSGGPAAMKQIAPGQLSQSYGPLPSHHPPGVVAQGSYGQLYAPAYNPCCSPRVIRSGGVAGPPQGICSSPPGAVTPRQAPLSARGAPQACRAPHGERTAAFLSGGPHRGGGG